MKSPLNSDHAAKLIMFVPKEKQGRQTGNVIDFGTVSQSGYRIKAEDVEVNICKRD